jgi:2-oxoglutarate dehydrogenase E2 component (dihydrolipoamide succinyltransferase)
MPRLGEGVIEGLIAKWLKQEGEQVTQYEPLLEIETDKVTTEATAEVAGTLLKIMVPEGETVEVGTVLAYIGEPGEEVTVEAGKEPAAQPTPAEARPAARVNGGRQPADHKEKETAGTEMATGRVERVSRGPFPAKISPVVARMAAEHDLDLDRIEGTGRGGRITKKDVQAYLETRPVEKKAPEKEPVTPVVREQPVPQPAPQVVAPGEIMPLSNIRRSIAEHMVRSKATSPHVTTVFEVDFSAIMAHRQEHKAAFAQDGARLTFTAYIVAAIAESLKQHPLVNSSWHEKGILLKKEINVGMAAAVPEGLIVPVIKGADGYNLLGLARVINDLTERARTGRLRPDDVQGGTFTLTNHGTSGSLFATPIINQPQCAILGMGIIEKRVVVVEDMIAIRPRAYVSLTFDHRILDGATGDGFMSTFKDILENW